VLLLLLLLLLLIQTPFRALWSMAICWLFAMPVGGIMLLTWKFYSGKKQGTIVFKENSGATWGAFFKKAWSAKAKKGRHARVALRAFSCLGVACAGCQHAIHDSASVERDRQHT
jgi:hypothetical protein